jgi:transcriptional regulator with XRE-family HTH domain
MLYSMLETLVFRVTNIYYLSTMADKLGRALRDAREKREWSLRDVEQRTKRRISNAQLALLEGDKVQKPSPHHLFVLATLYELDYAELMRLAGYVVPGQIPAGAADPDQAALLARVLNLSETERVELDNFLDYLRSKKTYTPR